MAKQVFQVFCFDLLKEFHFRKQFIVFAELFMNKKKLNFTLIFIVKIRH